MTSSAIAAMILGGLVLLIPSAKVSTGLARLLAFCEADLRTGYAHPGGTMLAGAGAALTVAVAARIAWCLTASLGKAALARRHYRRRLRMVGRGCGPGRDRHRPQRPAAWCLPGLGHSVALTTGAVGALDRSQLTAVLAHERAHQRGRHHLLVSLAGALNAAFPQVPALARCRAEVARLTELLADDAAASTSPRLTVAKALLTLSAGGPASAAALAAGRSATVDRVRRLIAAPTPRQWRRSTLRCDSDRNAPAVRDGNPPAGSGRAQEPSLKRWERDPAVVGRGRLGP